MTEKTFLKFNFKIVLIDTKLNEIRSKWVENFEICWVFIKNLSTSKLLAKLRAKSIFDDHICNSNYSAGDCGQMSVASGCTLIIDADLEIVSPPPRAKRASLPRKQIQKESEVGVEPHKDPQCVVAAAKPDSSNISRERSKNESVAKKHLLMKRLPPKPPTTQIRAHQKPIIDSTNIVRNQKNDHHIYECIEFGSQRQQSLPPGKNLAASIQNTLKSVSLGRYEAPIKAKGNTLLQVCISILLLK